MFVLFLFEISNVAPGTKHKHKQKAKKQNQNEPKKHTIFVDLLCLSAASARSVIRVSLHLLRRVRIKRLSLANWASLSVERKTKPPERAESARESARERARESGSFCLLKLCELLRSECAHWLYAIRQPYSNKTGQKHIESRGLLLPLLLVGDLVRPIKRERDYWKNSLALRHDLIHDSKLISKSRICN